MAVLISSLGYFSSSNLYSIICNSTFHQNLCIWQFVFNKAQWIEFMDGLNIRNFCRKNIKSLKEDCSIQFFSLYLCCEENVNKKYLGFRCPNYTWLWPMGHEKPCIFWISSLTWVHVWLSGQYVMFIALVWKIRLFIILLFNRKNMIGAN